MLRVTVLILGLVLSASWVVGGDDNRKDDLQGIQGKWKTVTIINGGELQKPTGKGGVWVVSRNRVIYPDLKVEDEINIDGSKKPKSMDIRTVRKGEGTVEYKAIFSLEGDRLRICLDLNGKGRPTVFESKAGSGHRLITLERLKD